MVTLYSKPGCPPCLKTKTRLKAKGIEFVEKDVTRDSEALAFVLDELRYTGVPVVFVDDETHWVGYHADRIDELV